MDQFTKKHLASWLVCHRRPSEFEKLYNKIISFVELHPEVLETLAWSDILTLAERI